MDAELIRPQDRKSTAISMKFNEKGSLLEPAMVVQATTMSSKDKSAVAPATKMLVLAAHSKLGAPDLLRHV